MRLTIHTDYRKKRAKTADRKDVHLLNPDQLESVGGASFLGVYRPGFQYKQEPLNYFRQCVGEETNKLG